MRSFKNHLSFLLPLFILLFSIQFATTLDRGLSKYELKLANDYSIVVVSKKKLTLQELQPLNQNIASLNEVDKEKYIQKLAANDISKSNLAYLKASLPSFYTIKLSSLPDKEILKELKNSLLQIPEITKVETYKKSYEKLHQFLILLSSAANIFTVFIFVITILLITKQMEIWTYEHKKRMYIMSLFGAPYWLKSAQLYKLVVIDSVIASLVVSATYLYIPFLINLSSIKNDLGVNLDNFSFISDSLTLLGFSIFISVIAVSITIFKDRK